MKRLIPRRLIPTLFKSLIISIVSASATFCVNSYQTDSSDYLLAFSVWLVMFVISVVLLALFETLEATEANKNAIDLVRKELSERIKSISIQSHMNKILKYAEDLRDEEIGKPLIKAIVDDHINQITTDSENNKFQIDGQSSSLLGYKLFWKILVKEQKRRNQNSEEPIILRITHSNNPNIWDFEKSRIALEMLELQANFVKEKGKLIRLFIVNETLNKNGHDNNLNNLIKTHQSKFNLKFTFKVAVNQDMLSYDFVWLNEEKIIIKWFSSASGDGLAWMEIDNIISPRDQSVEVWGIYWDYLVEQQIALGNKEIEKQLNDYISPKRQVNYEDL